MILTLLALSAATSHAQRKVHIVDDSLTVAKYGHLLTQEHLDSLDMLEKTAIAEGRPHGFILGAQLGYSFANRGLGFGFHFGYGFNDNIEAMLRYTFHFDLQGGNRSSLDHTTTRMQVMDLTARYKFRIHGTKLSVYPRAGVCMVVLHNSKLDKNYYRSKYGKLPTGDMTRIERRFYYTGVLFGGLFGGGVCYDVNEVTSLALDVSMPVMFKDAAYCLYPPNRPMLQLTATMHF